MNLTVSKSVQVSFFVLSHSDKASQTEESNETTAFYTDTKLFSSFCHQVPCIIQRVFLFVCLSLISHRRGTVCLSMATSQQKTNQQAASGFTHKEYKNNHLA